MAKKKTLSKVKKETWKEFSIFIRTRDWDLHGRQYIGEKRAAPCITCDKLYPVEGHGTAQAGHFISGRGNAILFDEEQVNAQCLTAESNLRLFNGKNKSITDISEGDELWAFNEDNFSREKAVVESVSSFVPDELYEVQMEDGNVFFATADHRVVANGEWVYIKDMLHNVLAYEILEL